MQFGFSKQQIGKALRFGQIHLALGEGPASKFTRFCSPQTIYLFECLLDCADHRPAAMAVNLNQILAGCAIGTGKPQAERLIQQLSTNHIGDIAQRPDTRFR